MKLITFWLITLFVLLSGCNSTNISSIQNNAQPEVMNPQQSSSEQKIEFQSVLSGSAETADGTPFSFNSYKSPDGVGVSTRFERRNSPADAKKELHRNIKAAIKILKREPKVDENGSIIGERAVLTVKQEESNNLQTIVIWNNGSQVHFIESLSFEQALKFEKWYVHNL